MTKSWTTDLPKFNWTNISEHPASPSWGQMESTSVKCDEWSLSDIDPSEWMASEESFDHYEQMEISFEESSGEQFKAMCEQHRNK